MSLSEVSRRDDDVVDRVRALVRDRGTDPLVDPRAVRAAILDVLDEIKVALLDGELDNGALDRLSRAIREERSQTDEPALEELLNEIETRAAVEQAKLQVSRAA